MRNKSRASELNDLFDSWARLLPKGPFHRKDTFHCPRIMPGQQELALNAGVICFTLYRGTEKIAGIEVPCNIIGAEGLVVAASILIDGIAKPYFALDGQSLPEEMPSA